MLFILDPNNPNAEFPPVQQAETEPDGLLAVGGDLSTPRLLKAYRSGIFPWYSQGQPILWWSPNPRTILQPEQIRISRSLRKTIRNSGLDLSIDRAFQQVVTACAEPRQTQAETWITGDMQQAYINLFQQQHAHSVEVWDGSDLVGGLYGVAIGKVFFGESMFSRYSDASKIALVFLCRELITWGYGLIDCQVYSDHLASLGAEEVDRPLFCELLQEWCDKEPEAVSWETGQTMTAAREILHDR
jgi:leucyl/phenylalanyl-tRNA---protein transferase